MLSRNRLERPAIAFGDLPLLWPSNDLYDSEREEKIFRELFKISLHLHKVKAHLRPAWFRCKFHYKRAYIDYVVLYFGLELYAAYFLQRLSIQKPKPGFERMYKTSYDFTILKSYCAKTTAGSPPTVYT